MSEITWSDDYSVGVKAMDDQHLRLVALVNDLDDAMRQGQGQAVLGKIFNELVFYTKTHFRDEEALMEKHGYPDLDEHRLKHESMTAQVIKYKQEADASKMGLTIKVMQFLSGWLTKHIAGTDKLYGVHLNGQGIR